MSDAEMIKELNPEERLNPGEVTLVNVGTNDLREFSAEMMRHYTVERDAMVVYITFTKSSEKLKQVFEDAGAKVKNILFVDCITKFGGSAPDRSGNTLFFEPKELTNLSMAVEDAVDSIPSDREGIVVIDTMSTVFNYNEKQEAKKFVPYLTAKLKERGIPTLMISVEEETDDTNISLLKNFSDSNIEISQEET